MEKHFIISVTVSNTAGNDMIIQRPVPGSLEEHEVMLKLSPSNDRRTDAIQGGARGSILIRSSILSTPRVPELVCRDR